MSEVTKSPVGKRLVKSKSGLKIVSQHERGVAPWDLAEPDWQNDKEVNECSSKDCRTKFDFLKRRHHCRRCGKIFCGKCCCEKVQFHRMQFVDPVRHCILCAPITKKEEEFFNKDIKLLFSGAPFSISGPSVESYLYNCKFSSDQRFILFDNHGDDGISIEPVALSKITEYSVSSEDSSEMTVTLVTTQKVMQSLTFRCPPEPSRKPSLNWLSAFQKAMDMIFESRNTVNNEDPS